MLCSAVLVLVINMMPELQYTLHYGNIYIYICIYSIYIFLFIRVFHRFAFILSKSGVCVYLLCECLCVCGCFGVSCIFICGVVSEVGYRLAQFILV